MHYVSAVSEKGDSSITGIDGKSCNQPHLLGDCMAESLSTGHALEAKTERNPYYNNSNMSR